MTSKNVLTTLTIFLYLLGIALRRGSYGAENPLTIAEIVVFTAIPIVVGFWFRSRNTIVLGVMVAAMIPFQKSIALVFSIGALALLPHLFRRSSWQTIRQTPTAMLFALFMGYVVVSWLLHLGGTTDLWSFPVLFASMLSIPAFYLLLFTSLKWSEEERRRFGIDVILLLIAQSGVALVFPLLISKPELYLAGFNGLLKGANAFFGLGLALPYADPDWNRGSLVDAHQLGFLLALLAVFLIAYGMYNTRRWSVIVGALMIYAFGMTETSHAVPGFLLGACLAVLAVFLVKKMRPRSITGILLVLVVGAPLAGQYLFYERHPVFSASAKTALMHAAVTAWRSDPLALTFGDGPAAFGSRVANKRVPKRITNVEYGFPILIPLRVSAKYETVLREAIKGRNGTTAFVESSGLVAMVGEFGIAGTIFFVGWIASIVRMNIQHMHAVQSSPLQALALTSLFAIGLIATSLVFRQYFEFPQIMTYVWGITLCNIGLPVPRP